MMAHPRVAVVTTFSKVGWDAYAQRMVSSWLANWTPRADLIVYPDEPVPLPDAPNLSARNEPIPEKIAFIESCRDNLSWNGGVPYNYRFDAVKFCHKPFALWDFMTYRAGDRYDALVWLDADTVTHAPINNDVLSDIAPPRFDIQFLGRCYKYTECGYLYFNLNAPPARALLDRWIAFYVNRTFRNEAEWHDSWLFDRAREMDPGLTGNDLTGHLPQRKGAGHPFINSFLGGYMDHYKGDARKATGAPRRGDLFIDHDADYWKRNPHAKAR